MGLGLSADRLGMPAAFPSGGFGGQTKTMSVDSQMELLFVLLRF